MDGDEPFMFDDDIFDVAGLPNDECHEHEECLPIAFQPVTPKWFVSGLSRDKDNLGMTTKYIGDLAYIEKRYEDAIVSFKRFQDQVKDEHNLMWRSAEEDVGRCYLKLNRISDSLSCAHNLQSMASNVDHYACSTNFFVDIYDRANVFNYEKLIQLKRSLLINPGHSSSWFKLGECIMKLFQIDTDKTFLYDIDLLDNLDRQVVTSFAICYLLERKKSCQSFARKVSMKANENALTSLQMFYKDRKLLDILLQSVKSKFQILLEFGKPSLVSIEHISPNSYLEILNDDAETGRCFDEKWWQCT